MRFSQANTEGAQKITQVRPFEEQLARSDGLYALPFTSLAFVGGRFLDPGLTSF